jgi:hypothetical protein
VAAWTSAEPLPFARRLEGQECASLKIGDKWGGLFDCAWFKFSATIPASAAGKPVAMLLDVNGEMCVVDERGVPTRGLTSLTSEFDLSLGKPGKRVVSIAAQATAGHAVEVWADCGCNDLFGNLQENGVVRQAQLVCEHADVEQLYYDFEVLLDLLKALPEASARWRQALAALSSAAKATQPDVLAGIVTARACLAPQLAKRGGDPDLHERHRSRPYGPGVVVAHPRDNAQERPYLCHSASEHGALSRIQVWHGTAAAATVDQGAASGDLPTDPNEGCRRSLGVPRVHVGGARYKCDRW